MLIGMLICHSSGNAQSRLEVGYVFGISNFLGDLGGNAGKGGFFLKDNMMSLTRFITGFHAGYHPSEYINFDLSYVAGKLEGADSLIKGNGGVEVARKTRDQHFRSPLKELTLTLEIFPTVYFEYDPNNVAGKIRPYLLFGIGVFQFNPQAQYIKPDGTREWVDLKPLRTEGQGMSSHPDRKEYSLTQMNIPYGFGVKYHLSRTISISLEAITRKTFTDYIDDVSTRYIDNNDFYTYFGATSPQAAIAIQMANKAAYNNGGTYKVGYAPGQQRGTPTNKDSYYTTSFKACFRIPGANEPRQRTSSGGKVIKCPKF
jgi:hypothetical protein